MPEAPCGSWKAPFRVRECIASMNHTMERRNSGTGVSPVRFVRPTHGRDARATTSRFMESPLSLLRSHWDHEPEFRKSFKIKTNVLRFMESLHGFLTVHLGNAPADRAVASWSAPVRWCFRHASIAKRHKTEQTLAGHATVTVLHLTPRHAALMKMLERLRLCFHWLVRNAAADVIVAVEHCAGARRARVSRL